VRHIVLMVTILVALTGCKKKRSPRAEPRHEEPAQDRQAESDDDLFFVAYPRVTDAPLPARFTSPLPSTVAALARGDSLPPAPMLRAGIASGDAATQSRVLDAVRAAASEGPIAPELVEYYVRLFGYSPDGAACAWARSVVTGPEPVAVRALFVRVLAQCEDPGSGDALIASGAPPDQVIAWAFESTLGDRAVPYDARIVEAATAVARDGEFGDARKIGFVLAAMGDRAVADAERLAGETKDRERRAVITIGMTRSKSARGRKLGKEACRVLTSDPMCRDDDADPGPDPTRGTLAEQIEYGYDTEELLTRFSRVEVVDGLRRCAGGTDREARSCLWQLSGLDRPAAAALAAKLADPADAGDALAFRVLRQFPEQAALEAYLDKLGFPAKTGTDAPSGPTAEDALMARGSGTTFDTETGMFPNEHDALLADLAALVGPALDGAVFEEVVPRTEDGPYLLRAYLDGKRYDLSAENFGDWYDVGAVIGLLDAMLIARGRNERFLMLETGDQTAIVIAGPARGLRALVDDHLVQVAGATDAMDTGKAFEDQWFEQLEREGKNPKRDVIIR
jgi:hypothetical protein